MALSGSEKQLISWRSSTASRQTKVEEALRNNPKIRFVEKGKRKGEDLYIATGQTDAGRYLWVAFILKMSKEALVVSARDMTDSERKRHGKK